MKTKYVQRNKVAFSSEPTHLVWMLRLEYEWMSNLKSAPSNSLKINVSYCVVESFTKNVRNFNLGHKMSSLDWHLKNYCHIWNQHPQTCQIVNFVKNLKYLNSEPKSLNLGIFGLEFENNIFIFEINNLKFL